MTRESAEVYMRGAMLTALADGVIDLILTHKLKGVDGDGRHSMQVFARTW